MVLEKTESLGQLDVAEIERRMVPFVYYISNMPVEHPHTMEDDPLHGNVTNVMCLVLGTGFIL